MEKNKGNGGFAELDKSIDDDTVGTHVNRGDVSKPEHAGKRNQENQQDQKQGGNMNQHNRPKPPENKEGAQDRRA